MTPEMARHDKHAYESGFDRRRHFLTLEHLDGQSYKHLIDKIAPEGGLNLPLSLGLADKESQTGTWPPLGSR